MEVVFVWAQHAPEFAYRLFGNDGMNMGFAKPEVHTYIARVMHIEWESIVAQWRYTLAKVIKADDVLTKRWDGEFCSYLCACNICSLSTSAFETSTELTIPDARSFIRAMSAHLIDLLAIGAKDSQERYQQRVTHLEDIMATLKQDAKAAARSSSSELCLLIHSLCFRHPESTSRHHRVAQHRQITV